METTDLAASTLRERMKARGVTVSDLARASEMQQPIVSGILSGAVRIGPLREARLARGILRLGLHREEPAPPKPEPEPVVIHIPRPDAAGASE